MKIRITIELLDTQLAIWSGCDACDRLLNDVWSFVFNFSECLIFLMTLTIKKEIVRKAK